MSRSCIGDAVLVPDLAGWRRERLPHVPEELTAFELAPDWICEVPSPTTVRSIAFAKCQCTRARAYRSPGCFRAMPRASCVVRGRDLARVRHGSFPVRQRKSTGATAAIAGTGEFPV
jgi:hypothetical protein